MWTVVYVSQEERPAKKLAEILKEREIISRVRRIGGNEGKPGFEVLVPKTEVDDAQNIIIDNELF